MMRQEVRPYLLDLGSTNGTFINNERIEAERFHELREQACVQGCACGSCCLLHSKAKHFCEASGRMLSEGTEGISMIFLARAALMSAQNALCHTARQPFVHLRSDQHVHVCIHAKQWWHI